MTDSPAICSPVDTRLFPIPVIQHALYTLNDHIEGCMVEQDSGQVVVRLVPLTPLTEEEIERAWCRALLTTSVNEHTFQASAPIRSYLAQAALSITSEAQRRVDEFIGDQISQRDIGYTEVPPPINIAPMPAAEAASALPDGVQVDAEASAVGIVLDLRRHLLPDVLWAVHQVHDASAQFVLNHSGSSLVVRLQPNEPTVEIEPLVKEFARWLDIATKRPDGARMNSLSRLVRSADLQLGPDDASDPRGQCSDWYASDNGFSSRLVMDKAHQPVVALAAATLSGQRGNVLDLGCGNGALLQKILKANPGIVPFGLESEITRLEHARLLIPEYADNLGLGNMFESEFPWSSERRYALVILMPGRLLEVGSRQAARLKKQIKQYCDNLLVYAYEGDWLTRYGNLQGLADQAGLSLLGAGRNTIASLAAVR